MKDVRVWFKKDGECRFISHLDLNRVMLRAIQKSKVPVWHTEGFNPHPFITFALPLSLGFRGKCESMDFRLTDGEYNLDEIPERLNACLPDGIRVYKAAEPVMKAGDIAFARFSVFLYADGAADGNVYEDLLSLFAMDSILAEKKSKSGVKEIDLKPAAAEYKIEKRADGALLSVTLPAGGRENINPMLFVGALEKYFGLKPRWDITREALYDGQMDTFA